MAALGPLGTEEGHFVARETAVESHTWAGLGEAARRGSESAYTNFNVA